MLYVKKLITNYKILFYLEFALFHGCNVKREVIKQLSQWDTHEGVGGGHYHNVIVKLYK